MPQHERLLSPAEICSRTAKNPIVFPPTASVTGTVTDAGLEWYERIAVGGVGTIIVEGTRLSLFRDAEFVRRLPQLAEVIHQHGVFACIQLFLPDVTAEGARISVSGGNGARAITTDEVRRAVDDFAHAANTALRAGFDAVEPHGAHGFFLNQFFSTKTNQRTDAYGGSLEGRMRLGTEIVQAVREAAGPKGLVFYRHTPEQEAGYTLDESLTFAAQLQAAGLDVLDVSPSTHNVTPRDVQGIPGPHVGLAEAFRDVIDVPIMAVGGMEDPDAAERVLARGKVQLVGICRGLIADAQWPIKVAEARQDEIVQCTKCNVACFGNLAEGKQIACTQWP